MRSVPDVAFVISNLIARQHASELILKTVTSMMFGLVLDILADSFYLGEPNRECTVTALPANGSSVESRSLIPKDEPRFTSLIVSEMQTVRDSVLKICT